MEYHPKSAKKHIGRTVLWYLGGAWVFIEALNFLIDRFRIDSSFLDILIILVLFGLPAVIVYDWFDKPLGRKAIILQITNICLALFFLQYALSNPSTVDPTKLRLLHFKSHKQQLAESIRSIAILPFSNLMSNQEQEYIVSGMHGALITELGKIGSIRVISKTSTLPYKNTTIGLPQIAADLKVDGLVEASVIELEKSVEIQLNLFSVYPEELQVWSESFSAKKNRLTSIYPQIIKEIAHQINLSLSSQEKKELRRDQVVHPEAYKAYLNGKFHLEKAGVDDMEKALQYFKTSISIDSTFAPVYAELANYYIFAAQMRLISPDLAIPNANSYVEKALNLDPNLPDANYNLALLKWSFWDFDSTIKAFEKALEINPNHVLANAFYGHALMLIGEYDQAITHSKLAVELDPHNDLVKSLYAVVLSHRGEFEQALAVFESMNPSSNFLNERAADWVSYSLGDTTGSILALNNIYENSLDIDLIGEYEKHGYNHALLYLIERIKENLTEQDIHISMYYKRLGDTEKVIKWLQKGYENHDRDIPYMISIYRNDSLKNDPRIIEIAEKVGLPL